ncbi:MAG: flagellar hook-basal body complex protein FliE [Rhodospirillales bacterium]|nr:flagellar hook-basal body complex protein FliE [Rhodospirillales bacterium]
MSGGIPTITITPSGISPGGAAAAYARTDQGGVAAAGESFGGVLDRAISGAIALSREADQASLQAVAGKGDITSVVTAVSRAELALQAATTIRDKVVAAYQTIMSMPI